MLLSCKTAVLKRIIAAASVAERANTPSQAAGTPGGVTWALPLPAATAGPLGDVISIVGLLAVSAWVGWRFGPTLARVTGWGSWWLAWACGSQGGYGYCAAFVLLGVLVWGSGTLWYARRYGRWPSAVSARLLARPLCRHGLTEGIKGRSSFRT
jgi:hypothetical protein